MRSDGKLKIEVVKICTYVGYRKYMYKKKNSIVPAKKSVNKWTYWHL